MSDRIPDSAIPDLSVPKPATTPIAQIVLPVVTKDGSRFELICVQPVGKCRQRLYWLPALGVPARHYLPFAQALAAHGVAVVIHEWRGIGSSNRRANRRGNWGYRELLLEDLPAGMAAMRTHWPQTCCWLGGHSLGGQLSALYASLHPAEHAGLVLVASGAPYWRRFRHGWAIAVAYVAAPLLAGLLGRLPGRRIGFGGNEARGVIADWARSGRTGRYAAAGLPEDFEQPLASLRLPLLALRLAHDWLGPPASLAYLLGKMPHVDHTVAVIAAADMDGYAADHFSWMKTPAAVAARIATWMHQQPDVATSRPLMNDASDGISGN